MSGWIILFLLIGLSAATFYKLRVGGPLLQLVLAALALGGAGYALQGRPALAGASSETRPPDRVMPLAFARHAFFGQFTATEHWLIMSESLARRGRTADSVNIVRSALREHPRDPQLWIGLGNALIEHGGILTPPAELAYRRAAELAPGHPAPAFFLGLAFARSGDRETATKLWRAALATAPADASWRPLVEDGIAALEGQPRVR